MKITCVTDTTGTHKDTSTSINLNPVFTGEMESIPARPALMSYVTAISRNGTFKGGSM